jgi:hypothetical protein
MPKLGQGVHLTQDGVAAIFSDVQVLLAESEDELERSLYSLNMIIQL